MPRWWNKGSVCPYHKRIDIYATNKSATYFILEFIQCLYVTEHRIRGRFFTEIEGGRHLEQYSARDQVLVLFLDKVFSDITTNKSVVKWT